MTVLRNSLLLLLAIVAGLVACDADQADPAPSSGSIIERLSAPAELDGLPRRDDARDRLPRIVQQPPGLAFVINGYGHGEPPPLTLEAYYGNRAGIEVVGRVLDSRYGGSATAAPGVDGSGRCGSAADRSVTCWRRTDTLVVAVTARDGRSAPETSAILGEAWQAITT